ncbi:hypothetical protein WH47_00797 [Habropoda laboriosa]|uniref:Uncharacterized protein n=1 Tax=Habropoda laboriosa TaxID=597456 RepID=A0A0L7QKC8_9HYME|nr:hypothetical protein WH47_00797 [Habropoda laboriosa]
MASARGFVKNVYKDPFKWSVIKSIGIFVLGIKIALECQGMNLMPPIS